MPLALKQEVYKVNKKVVRIMWEETKSAEKTNEDEIMLSRSGGGGWWWWLVKCLDLDWEVMMEST